jgi:hypothetical protein
MHVRFGERVITVKSYACLEAVQTSTTSSSRTKVRRCPLPHESIPQELEGLAFSQVTDPTLIAEAIVRFVDVQRRAFEIFLTGEGPAENNWLRAERALLAI